MASVLVFDFLDLHSPMTLSLGFVSFPKFFQDLHRDFNRDHEVMIAGINTISGLGIAIRYMNVFYISGVFFQGFIEKDNAIDAKVSDNTWFARRNDVAHVS